MKSLRTKDSRLWKVCDIVRRRLGLDTSRFEYDICKKCHHEFDNAECNFSCQGWKYTIVFHSSFFKETLGYQLEVVVHEHLHAAMIPVNQFYRNLIRDNIKKARQTDLHETATYLDEIVVDRLTKPLLGLMMPEIKRVL